MKSRIIVCGLDRAGLKIFCLLRQQGAAVVGVNDKPVPDQEDDIIIGDLQASATLLAAGIASAKTLVLAGSDETLNLAILLQARILNPKIRIINRLFNTSLGDRLDKTLSDHVTLSVAALASPVFTFAALGTQAIGQLQLFNQTWSIHEEHIDENHPWRGCAISELWNDRTRMLIYYLPGQGKVDLVSAVLYGQYLQPGDRLIIATKPRLHTIRKSIIRKLLKVVSNLRPFQQHAQSIVVVTTILLLTILIATVTYICVNLNTSIADALYFSVGMITGAGGNEQVAEHTPDSIKLFTSIMMLVGAAIVGIFYALLNDFVLGTRLKQFWDAARVPQSNHYIVCGLGSIGVQIVNQLHANGYEVVVIEPDQNNRFLNTIRALGIPVIHGDAGLPVTLKAAHIDQALALLAVTSNDTTNLEIALNGKGISPKVPAIIRYEDAHLAKMAQQVFEFEAVLSPAELAAPAFAAAALGEKILGNGMTADSLWVALATLITPGHPFCGRSVKEAAMDTDFVPLYIETAHQTIHGWNLLDVYLNDGDVLYLTIPAVGLEQLWRVVPSSLMAS